MSYLGIREEFKNKEKFDETKKKNYENAEQIIERSSSQSKDNSEDVYSAKAEITMTGSKIFLALVLTFLACVGLTLLILGICTILHFLFEGILWLGILLILFGILMIAGIYPLYSLKMRNR